MTAARRSQRLLSSKLSPEQRRTWTRHRWIDVPSTQWPNTRYRLMPHCAYRLEGRLVCEHLCIGYQDGFLCDADDVLAKLLLLRSSERRFRRIAAIHRYRIPFAWTRDILPP